MVGTTPPFASFFGFRSRTLTFFGVSFLCAILIFLSYLVADCSGGNSRPLHPSGVGGGHFLIKKSVRRYRTVPGIEPWCGLLSLTLYVEVSLVMLATLDLMTLDVTARVGCHYTALGVFFRFQV